jgi:peptidoglycan L-alanyl-D-glutamate endopeptidase CwlK
MIDAISLQRIDSLNQRLIGEAKAILGEAQAAMPTGVTIRITHALRTVAEQNALFAIGRTKPGRKVTNARGGDSFHNYGLALDFCLIVNGKASFTVDANWLKVIETFERYGWESGHHWKFTDSPHVQKTFGLSIADLKGGRRP